MRIEFFKYLYELMKANPNIWALTGDLGFIGFDKIRDEMPDRFINCGAAEQSMLDIACGLAMEGKIPIVYSITSFLLYRPFETWRTYINHEKLHIIGIGSGRDDDYKHDGFSHFAGDDKKLFGEKGILDNVNACWPTTTEIMKLNLRTAIESNLHYYINLIR